MRKKNSVKIFWIALFSMSFFTALKSQTYYVSVSGNDNNNGTSINTAWKSIAKINSLNLSPGTTVLFEGGQVFSGGIYLDNADAGSATNSVTISSYGNGRATISPGNNTGFYAYNTQGVNISDLIFEGSGENVNTANGVLFYTDLPAAAAKLSTIHITNVEVLQFGKTGIAFGSANGNMGFKNVLVDSVHVHHIKQDGIITFGFTSQIHVGWAHENVTIRNSEIDHVTGFADVSTHRGSGIILGQVNNGWIEKTVAHDNGSGNTHCGGPGGIWAWDCNNITIQHCESHHNSSGSGCDGLGFDLDGGVTNSVMQYNYSHDNDGAGYLLGQYDYARPWLNNVVRYNISENDGRTNAGGITLFKGAGTSMSGCKIYNNTIYTSASPTNINPGALTFVNWHTGINAIEIYNNIFQTTGGAALMDVPVGYAAVFTGNLYWSTGAPFKIYYQGNTYSNIAAWRAATGNEQAGTAPTGITADPCLSNSGNGGIVFPNLTTQLNAYSLANNSPAIDAGLDLQSLFAINPGPQDFFGNAIYSGNATDIGAHELTESITTSVENANSAVGNIILYPNPVKAGDPIFIKDVTAPYSATLFSMTGAETWRQAEINADVYSISTNNFSAGTYLLLVVDGRGVRRTGKVVVE